MLDKYYHTKDIYYTREKMLAYMRDELPDFEKRAFEKLLEEDEFLRDAYAGLKMQSIKENHKVFEKIESDIDIITGAKKPRILNLNARTLAVAAMFIIFLTVSFFIINQLNKSQQQKIAGVQAEEYPRPALDARKSDSLLHETLTEVSAPPSEQVAVITQEPVNEALETRDDYREDTNATTAASELRLTEKEKMKEGTVTRDTELLEDATIVTKAEDEESDVHQKSEAAKPANAGATEVRIEVEKMPEFPGGEQALYEFLAKNIKYPALARENGVEGTVYVKFLVDAKGKISDVSLMKGIGSGCDEEAIRVVQKMPRWSPGTLRGEPVDVYYTLPVKFKLM